MVWRKGDGAGGRSKQGTGQQCSLALLLFCLRQLAALCTWQATLLLCSASSAKGWRLGQGGLSIRVVAPLSGLLH